MSDSPDIANAPSYVDFVFSVSFLLIVLWTALGKTIGNLLEDYMLPSFRNENGTKPLYCLAVEFAVLSILIFILTKYNRKLMSGNIR